MKSIKYRIELDEEMLGTSSSDPNLHETYIASKAPDAITRAEEIEAIGVENVITKGRTVFPRLADGTPFLWDYQIKGFLKEAASFMRKLPGTECSKVKAYKKEIDGLIFVHPRRIPIRFPSELEDDCQRPLRAQTPQGERISIADSVTVPAGSTMECEIVCLVDSDAALVDECMSYGYEHGLGQWRNSGKGRFSCEEIEEFSDPEYLNRKELKTQKFYES